MLFSITFVNRHSERKTLCTPFFMAAGRQAAGWLTISMKQAKDAIDV